MSKEEIKDALIIGIGNSGREDDGLGWLMLDYIKKEFPYVHCEYRYQLQVEDAEMISHYRAVIFVDATKEEVSHGFYFKECLPHKMGGITSHLLEPETVLYLEHNLYKRQPLAYILGIQGYQWELRQKLSSKAMSNLMKAKVFLKENMQFILNREFINDPDSHQT